MAISYVTIIILYNIDYKYITPPNKNNKNIYIYIYNYISTLFMIVEFLKVIYSYQGILLKCIFLT